MLASESLVGAKLTWCLHESERSIVVPVQHQRCVFRSTQSETTSTSDACFELAQKLTGYNDSFCISITLKMRWRFLVQLSVDLDPLQSKRVERHTQVSWQGAGHRKTVSHLVSCQEAASLIPPPPDSSPSSACQWRAKPGGCMKLPSS